MSRSDLLLGLNVPFDQVPAQSIDYALIRHQCSIRRLPLCGLTHASTGLVRFGNIGRLTWRYDMSEIAKTEAISRRKALALAGLGTVTVLGLGLAASSVAVSEAEAATVGMNRRQDRRGGRTDRRQDRRTGR
jgi:hypothetical protein